MKLTAKRKLLKKQQIQLSAIRIVNQHGFEQATMEQIAAELNMTKGALYYYFKNKEDLLYQCHQFVLSNALITLERMIVSEQRAEQKLQTFVQAHIQSVIDERDFFNLMLEPSKAFSKEQLTPILQLRKRYTAILDEVITQGITEGVFHVESPFIARMAILGGMNWIQQWYKEQGALSREEIEQYFQQLIRKTLS